MIGMSLDFVLLSLGTYPSAWRTRWCPRCRPPPACPGWTPPLGPRSAARSRCCTSGPASPPAAWSGWRCSRRTSRWREWTGRGGAWLTRTRSSRRAWERRIRRREKAQRYGIFSVFMELVFLQTQPKIKETLLDIAILEDKSENFKNIVEGQRPIWSNKIIIFLADWYWQDYLIK